MAPQKAEVSESPGKSDVVLDTSGTLEVRLATTQIEIEAAQRLRFDVFYREMSAQATPEMLAAGRDFDPRLWLGRSRAPSPHLPA